MQFKYAENPETRRTAYEKFENRLAINKPIMAKFLDLRRQIAKLLGYPTWADYITEVKMVKNAKSVKEVHLLHTMRLSTMLTLASRDSSSQILSRSFVPSASRTATFFWGSRRRNPLAGLGGR